MFPSMRKYLSFSENEYYGLLVAAVFLGFMFSFRKWGAVTPDIKDGLIAMLIATLLVLFAIVVHLSAQKIIGLLLGYSVRWAMEIRSLLISLILCFLTTGYFVFPLYGSISIDPVPELRFGRRPGFKFYHLGWIAVAGNIANLLLALMLRFLWNFSNLDVLADFALMNVLIAIVMSLPIPAADGLHLFFASRIDYVSYIATVLFFSLLLATQLPVIWLIVVTALFALCAWIGYWLVEKNLK